MNVISTPIFIYIEVQSKEIVTRAMNEDYLDHKALTIFKGRKISW
jgi:hypothetical protein